MRVVTGVDARLYLYPPTDHTFIRGVATSLAPLRGRPIEDAGILAAAEALLRTTYPLANIQMRPDNAPHDDGIAWDVFRDGTVLDHELVRRAGAGDLKAAGQLYDRHHRLAYALAVQAAGRSEAAEAAVTAGFCSVIAHRAEVASVRIRLAQAVRDAAQRTATPREGTEGGPAGIPDHQWAVIELAHVHGLLDAEIAEVLGVEVAAVRRLARHGLTALARSRTD